MDSSEQPEDGKSKGNIESWQWGYGVDERAHDKPGRDGDE
jgi:hypothetical protein